MMSDMTKNYIRGASFIGEVDDLEDLLDQLTSLPRPVPLEAVTDGLKSIHFDGSYELWIMNAWLHNETDNFDVILRQAGGQVDLIRFMLGQIITGKVMVEPMDGGPVYCWITGLRAGVDETFYWISNQQEGFPRGLRCMSILDFPYKVRGSNWLAFASADPKVLTLSNFNPENIEKLIEKAKPLAKPGETMMHVTVTEFKGGFAKHNDAVACVPCPPYEGWLGQQPDFKERIKYLFAKVVARIDFMR